MSKLAFRVVKYKAGNIFGIQKHNQREGEKHTNKEIDPTKTHLNTDIVNNENINYSKKIKQIIENNKTSKTPVRETSVLMVSSIVSSSKEFFEKLDHSEQLRFFKESTEYFKTKFGEDNLVSANIHFDEKTPHMHISFVPITTDGRLSGKDVVNRSVLLQVQKELPLHLASKGFDIQRGIEGNKVKHLDTLEYKRGITEISKSFENLDSMFRQSKLNKKDMIIAKENLDNLKELVNSSLEVVSLRGDVEVLKASLERSKDDLKRSKKEAKENIDTIAKSLDYVDKIEIKNKNLVTALEKSKQKNDLFVKLINKIGQSENLTQEGQIVVKSILKDGQKELDNINNSKQENKPRPKQQNGFDMDI
ncbi:MAG: MobV family relaxase [Aeromonas hydrophila]